MRGHGLSRAARIAVDLTVSSIARTRAAGTDVRFGVNFEEGLGDFIYALREEEL
jgi:pyridoxine kinase